MQVTLQIPSSQSLVLGEQVTGCWAIYLIQSSLFLPQFPLEHK